MCAQSKAQRLGGAEPAEGLLLCAPWEGSREKQLGHPARTPGCQQVPAGCGLPDSGPWGHRKESRSHPRVSSPQSLSTNVLVTWSVQNAERMIIELLFITKPPVPYLTTDLEQF